MALAEDIECWLADEPVLAWPDPWPTRLRRRAKRHRTTIVAAVTTVVALAALSGAYSWYEGRFQDQVEQEVWSMLVDPELNKKETERRSAARCSPWKK